MFFLKVIFWFLRKRAFRVYQNQEYSDILNVVHYRHSSRWRATGKKIDEETIEKAMSHHSENIEPLSIENPVKLKGTFIAVVHRMSYLNSECLEEYQASRFFVDFLLDCIDIRIKNIRGKWYDLVHKSITYKQEMILVKLIRDEHQDKPISIFRFYELCCNFITFDFDKVELIRRELLANNFISEERIGVLKYNPSSLSSYYSYLDKERNSKHQFIRWLISLVALIASIVSLCISLVKC